jgi:hypothetical protein
LNADTSPASVFSTQSNDEVNQFVAHWRSAGAPVLSPSPPFALGGFPMPSQQRARGNHEGPPPVSREQPAERSQNRSIGWSISHAPRAMTLENSDLVTEHHDFDVLVGLGSAGQRDEPKETAQSDVEEREGHDG